MGNSLCSLCVNNFHEMKKSVGGQKSKSTQYYIVDLNWTLNFSYIGPSDRLEKMLKNLCFSTNVCAGLGLQISNSIVYKSRYEKV